MATRCFGWCWAANLIAMLFQALSAKLGIVTGRNLAEMCRDNYPVSAGRWRCGWSARSPRWRPIWPSSWVVRSACRCCSALPLLWGMAITAVVTYAILMLERRGFREMEIVIGVMVADDRPLLSGRTVPGPGRLCRRRTRSRHSQLPDRDGAADLRRHHRRNRDAARGIPAFRADPVSRHGPQRRRAPHAGALLQPGGASWRWRSPDRSTWPW